MGGSGGGFFFERRNPPSDFAKKIRDVEERTKDDVFETDTSDLLRQLLTYSNNRDTETINTHLKTIKDALHLGIDGTIDLRYGGSISKHTYVDGLSDIDTLVILNNSELLNKTPQEVKEYFYERLCERFPRTDIKMGKLAVTVMFTNGFEIQLLPCIKHDKGIKITSSRDTNTWSHVVNPENFAKVLRYVNTKTSGKLVPVIKLAKSVISSFPENRRLSGYHVESLAIEIFANYKGEKSPKAMLKHFFNEASKYVLQPVKDKSGQSVHVDSYLGASNSVDRKMVSDSLSTISRKMQNADGNHDIRLWQDILK